jgi:hypothetical protein
LKKAEGEKERDLTRRMAVLWLALGESMRCYLKNKLKQKGLKVRLKWYSTCLASARP